MPSQTAKNLGYLRDLSRPSHASPGVWPLMCWCMVHAQMVVPGAELDQPAGEFIAIGDMDAIEHSFQCTEEAFNSAVHPRATRLRGLPRPPGHADDLNLSLLPQSVTLLPSQWQQGQGLVLQSGEHASGNYWVDVSALAISSDDPLYAAQNVNPVAIEVLARGAPTAPVPVPLDRTRLPLIILLLATAMLVLTRRTQGSV